MKRIMLIALLLALVLPATPLKAQRGSSEFELHKNGFIYSDTTMAQLAHIVDSLNLKYKRCDLWKKYTSVPQTAAYVIRLDSGKNIKAAYQDIKKGISFDVFLQKYPLATYEKMLVLKSLEIDYEKKNYISYAAIAANGYGYRQRENDTSKYNNPVKDKWKAEYNAKGTYSHEYVTALYFPAEFATVQLPLKYGRMVQYVDCMIDTNSSIFFNNASEDIGWLTQGKVKTNKITSFFDYIETNTGAPDKQLLKNKKTRENYYDLRSKWYTTKDSLIEVKLEHTDEFQKRLKEAIDLALKDSIGNAGLEEYAQKYLSPKDVLRLKRQRVVWGMCSRDNSPRVHALEIAKLSAETVSWEIFLRAHLDIMNDNFNRASDASYAWGRRKTYIKEIEALQLDIPSLMFGTTLRIDKPSGTHYFGSIERTGRALVESEKAKEIEAMMAEAIADTSLDVYNRFMFYSLFKNYAYHIEDEMQKKAVAEIIDKAANTLPDYIVADIKSRKE